MNNTRKTRIPSVPYLKQKIAEIGAFSNPTQDEIQLLGHYKKLLEQRKGLETHQPKDRTLCTEDTVS
jgi:hypothetical protein